MAQDNLAAADRIVSAIYERCLILCDFPEAGPERRDLAPELRQLVEGSYIVLYRIRGRRIDLIRAIHARRRIGPDII